ncbi:MAG TPA: tetratricopeptide repeat protein [Bacteroidia bacterium]|nr:tetratricopeptide repeat protein [Bacteroidia bacterium]
MKKIIQKAVLILFSIALLCSSLSAQNSQLVVDSLKKLLIPAIHDTLKIKFLNEIGREYVTSDSTLATQYASEALNLSLKLNYKPGEMNSHNVLGLVLYYSSSYDEALKHHLISKQLAEQLGDKAKLAVALNNIGLVYDDKTNYNTALSYYLESLKLAENSEKGKWQTGTTLNNIALIYQTQGKYEDALKFHNRSLKIKKEINNKKGVGSSLHNIGLVYKLMGEYEKSLEYYFLALTVRKENNDENGMALTLNNIGSVYESQQLFDKAFGYFEQSLELRKKLKDKYGLAVSLFSMGSNYCARNQYEKGFEYYNKALQIGKEIGSKDLLKRGYESMALAAANRNNYQEAFNYQILLMAVKDSIYNAESSKQLNELQTKYESEKKQKEIELPTKNDEIKELQLNKNKLWLVVSCTAVLLVLLLTALLFNRYKLKQKANDLLEHQNTEITQQKKEITDSINYAKRIQESILPPVDHWKKILPQSFIFYRPKDIVSGDFYWIEQKNDTVCFAAVDCTGHGVPGALMSVVGFNLLTQAVNEVGLTKPSEILKHLDAGVTKTLRQSETGKGVKDGMDLSLCSLNLKTLELQYAGAFNSLYYIVDGVFNEIKADKFPIGVNLDGKVDNYKNHTVQLKKGDCVYLYSDGYADQFGGAQGKKLKYKKLKELLTVIASDSIENQQKKIETTFDDWKGSLEQVDDVVIIGLKI